MILLVLAWFSTHIMTVYLVEDVRLRWKTLRDYYVREIRKKKQPSGSTTRAVAPWELQQSMSFLNDFVKHRKLISGAVLNSAFFSLDPWSI